MMNKEARPTYEFFSDFVFRTPTLPIAKLPGTYQDLHALLNNDFVLEAIALASPTLRGELDKVSFSKSNLAPQFSKLYASTYKYISRMTQRPMPFGLFAACGVGQWGESNSIKIDSAYLVTHSQFDMNLIEACILDVVDEPNVRPHISLQPNDTLYVSGGTLRYIKIIRSSNERVHSLSSIQNNKYLTRILEDSKVGLTQLDLSRILMEMGIGKAQADSYINQLIDHQVLVSAIRPSLTDKDVLERLMMGTNLNSYRNIVELEELNKVKKELIAIDQNNDLQSKLYYSRYKSIQNNTSQKVRNPFHVDCFRKASTAKISTTIQNKIISTLRGLRYFAKPHAQTRLDKFKVDFLERYGTQAVKLVEVVDVESGLGYPNFDLEGINSFVEELDIRTAAIETNSGYSERDGIVMRKLADAYRTGKFTIHLTDEDLGYDRESTSALPSTLAVMFEFVDPTLDKIRVDFIGGGSSAVNLIGRFASGDKDILKIANEIIQYEESSSVDCIHAEIIHIPDNESGNVLRRPALREFEITCLAPGSSSSDQQILISDLYIQCVNGEFILTSNKLRKRVIPRLSSAHNYNRNSLPIYKFLCDLQFDGMGKRSFYFEWNRAALDMAFLPRVEYNDVVISPAMWILKTEDVLRLFELPNPFVEFASWKSTFQIKNEVLLRQGDKKLYFDLSSELGILSFLSSIKNVETIELNEYFGGANTIVSDENNLGYSSEIIAFIKNNNFTGFSQQPPIRIDRNVQRYFRPGEEWVYYKVYSGISTADEILITTVTVLVRKLQEEGKISKWFFIRYADPKPHLRLRMKLTKPEYFSMVNGFVNSMTAQLINDRSISNISIEIYERELERYDLIPYEDVETIFEIESSSGVSFLAINRQLQEDHSWQYSSVCINDLLDVCNFPLQDKLRCMEKLRNGFIIEHGNTKSLRVQLDVKFRKLRLKLSQAISRDFESREIQELIDHRRHRLAAILQDTFWSETLAATEDKRVDFVGSLLHMFVNRIFKSQQRTCEMLLYDLLWKYYKSEFARLKSGTV